MLTYDYNPFALHPHKTPATLSPYSTHVHIRSLPKLVITSHQNLQKPFLHKNTNQNQHQNQTLRGKPLPTSSSPEPKSKPNTRRKPLPTSPSLFQDHHRHHHHHHHPTASIPSNLQLQTHLIPSPLPTNLFHSPGPRGPGAQGGGKTGS